MVRWNSSKEGKMLASLFDNGIADPRFSKPADIDPIKEMKDEFKEFTAQTFRNNYRTTASNWMTGKAIEGTRLKSLNCELMFCLAHLNIIFVSLATCCCSFHLISRHRQWHWAKQRWGQRNHSWRTRTTTSNASHRQTTSTNYVSYCLQVQGR